VGDDFRQIQSRNELSTQSVRQLIDFGFVIIPGPFSGEGLIQLAAAYDEMMALASGPEFKIASATTRMSDVLNYGSAFDEIFLYPPLHEACAHFIGAPFRLSSFLARTLRPNAIAQDLHADLLRSSEDAPLVGFILMIDAFREDNGATRFVPSSHKWPDVPSNGLKDTKGRHASEVLGCGESGSILVFNGGVWHGHTANLTPNPRRSIQGNFVRRNAQASTDFSRCLLPVTQARMSVSARYLLGLD
jgi:hypothetical protein